MTSARITATLRPRRLQSVSPNVSLFKVHVGAPPWYLQRTQHKLVHIPKSLSFWNIRRSKENPWCLLKSHNLMHNMRLRCIRLSCKSYVASKRLDRSVIRQTISVAAVLRVNEKPINDSFYVICAFSMNLAYKCAQKKQLAECVFRSPSFERRSHRSGLGRSMASWMEDSNRNAQWANFIATTTMQSFEI